MSRIPSPGRHRYILIGFLLPAICLNLIPDAYGAAAVQRRIQQQKEMQAQMVAQYQQQVIAQQQAQQVAAYQQAMVQRRAVMEQATYQKAAAEYAAYKQAMQVAVAKRNAELQAAQQLKAMIAQKQAAEVAMVQKAVAQRQASEVAAYQQAVAQKQTAQMIQYKQAVENKQLADQMTQAQLNQQIRQYADVMAKRQAVMQAQAVGVQQAQAVQEIEAYNQYQQVKAVQARSAVESKMAAQQAQKAFNAQATQAAAGASIAKQVLDAKNGYDNYQPATGSSEEPQTIVDIHDLWKALDEGSEAWDQIIDPEIKALTVAEYIDRFKKVGITIKKSPGFYVNWIEAISKEDPTYLQGPFMNVLSYAAIMEYDFDNGQNKDELARRVLGEANFRTNKARIELR